MELIGQLAACQLTIEAVIAELTAKGIEPEQVAAMRSQLAGLVDMRGAVAIAGGRELASMRAEVAAAVASAAEMVSAARQGGTSQNAADADLTPQQRAHRILSEVSRDVFERKVLDPYLRFRDAEDERAYRQREKERKDEIAKALASNTPEGDRRAAELTLSQLSDAKSHGADRSPDFARLQQQATEARQSLNEDKAAAVAQAGPSQAPVIKTALAIPSDADIQNAINATLALGNANSAKTHEGDIGHGLGGRTAVAINRASGGPSVS